MLLQGDKASGSGDENHRESPGEKNKGKGHTG